MKIKVKKTTVENVELELPVYKKGLCHFFKIFSETNAIMVCDLEDYEQIGVVGISSALHNTIDCDYLEFQKKYDNVIKKLNNLIMKAQHVYKDPTQEDLERNTQTPYPMQDFHDNIINRNTEINNLKRELKTLKELTRDFFKEYSDNVFMADNINNIVQRMNNNIKQLEAHNEWINELIEKNYEK